MELIHKNILPVHSSIKQAIIGTPGRVSDGLYLVIHTPAECPCVTRHVMGCILPTPHHMGAPLQCWSIGRRVEERLGV